MPNINIIRRVVLNNPPRGAVVAGSGYVGPGDIVGSWFAWYGLRAYSAAYAAPGNNPAIDIVDQAGANQLTVNILASGKLDLASINAWVTAHSVSTIKVGKVYDQAGTTHVSQATLANMPTLALNVIGALPSLHFDASQAQGLFSASGALSTAQPFYMSSVHIRQRGNLTDFNSVLITDQTVGILTGTGPDQIGIFGGSVNSIAAADLAVHSLKALFNGSTSALYVDDLLTPISGGAAAFSGSTIGLGAQPGGQPRRWDGYIFEAGLIAGDQSASNHALYANEASYGYFSDQSLNANGFDIILLAGQSNMAGRAAQGTLDPTPPGVLKQLSCYPSSPNYQTIISGSDPLQMLEGIETGLIGPGHSFAIQYLANNPTRKVLLVPMAVGGTGLVGDRWAVGGDLYGLAIAFSNMAITQILALYPTSKFVGVGWLQGENDNGQTQAAYAAALDATIDGFRANITGASTSWFAVLGMAPGFISGTNGAVAAAHADTPNRKTKAVYVPGISGHDDGLHYDAVAQRALGPAWANAVVGL